MKKIGSVASVGILWGLVGCSSQQEVDDLDYVDLDTYDQPDAKAPPPPTDLTCVREADFARLTWVNPASVQYERIVVYRMGQSVAILPGCATTCALLHVPGEDDYDVEGE